MFHWKESFILSFCPAAISRKIVSGDANGSNTEVLGKPIHQEMGYGGIRVPIKK